MDKPGKQVKLQVPSQNQAATVRNGGRHHRWDLWVEVVLVVELVEVKQRIKSCCHCMSDNSNEIDFLERVT